MNKNLYLVFAGVLIAVCLALCEGVWWTTGELRTYREEYEALESDRNNSNELMAQLRLRNNSLNQINRLNIENATAASDFVEFFSQVRQAADSYKVNIVSMTQGSSENILQLQLQGNYYSLAHVFAKWRTMPFASRMTSLKIRRDSTSPESLVEADVIIEAMRSDG